MEGSIDLLIILLSRSVAADCGDQTPLQLRVREIAGIDDVEQRPDFVVQALVSGVIIDFVTVSLLQVHAVANNLGVDDASRVSSKAMISGFLHPTGVSKHGSTCTWYFLFCKCA